MLLAAFAVAGTLTCLGADGDYKVTDKDAPEDGAAVPELVGQKFLDLEMADTKGESHKLSEYVGQGKWVLVDFWASWCGDA